ncbi:MAG: glycerol-3-phosphate acyltransferase [Candidatus Phosphoribacter sp.]
MTTVGATGWIDVALTALAWLAMSVVAFLVGGISPATIVARMLGRDIASAGSGNPGATNAGRVLGRKWGVLVGILDVLKGYLPTLLAMQAVGVVAAYVVGVAAVLGHVYSPYLRGRGGKGVATGIGAILAVHPWYAVVLAVLFALVSVAARWVALGSLVSSVVILVGGGLAAAGMLPGSHGWPTAIWAWVLGFVIVLRHRVNILDRVRRRDRT